MSSSKDILERKFHLEYCDLPKVQRIVAQISWRHNLNIFQRCKNHLIHKLKDINAEETVLAAIIKRNLEEVGM